jgi:trans-2,3-dihydro-3-hydroxyanthranilate isomerase
MTHRLRLLERAEVDPRVRMTMSSPGVRHGGLPPVVAGTGLRHLLVSIAEPAQLPAIELDAKRIRALARTVGVDSVALWAAVHNGDRMRLRDLCAPIGTLEEAASGTTAATLGLYLAAQGWLTRDELVVEQGVEMGRPTRIEARVAALHTVTVRGRACKLLSGDLNLSTTA